MSSPDFDPLDFQPNSGGAMVVRIVRVQDIVKALRCTEAFALEVVAEIRGQTSDDGKVAFVLPSQLAAWAYKHAGKPAPPFPVSTALVDTETDEARALQRGSQPGKQQHSVEPAGTSRRPPSKLILSKREAAKLLGVGRNRTLSELIGRGLLKTVEVNGHLKIPRADIERIAAEGFDVDAPSKGAKRSRPRAESRSQDLETAIRKLKL